MYCTVCRHLQKAQIVLDWAYTGSLRETARRYGIGYRSLQRHLDLCIPSIMAERERREYEAAFKRVADWLRVLFSFKMRKKRPKSIVKKKVEYTWSRRSWKDKKG